MESLNKFYRDGCKCHLGPDKSSCVWQFRQCDLLNYISSCREFLSNELDLVILGQLAALFSNYKIGEKRQRNLTVYKHRGITICRETFCFVHGIGKRRLEALKTHFTNNGLTTRQHGNTKRLPHNTTDTDTISHCVKYIENHANVHGLCLPGRVPCHRDLQSKVLLLPSHHSKAFVHRQYEEICREEKSYVPMLYGLFCQTWSQFLPYVIAIKPRSDLCFTCQENNGLIIKSANSEISEKSSALKIQQDHLMQADLQAQDYRSRRELSRETIQTINPDISFKKKSPNSVDITNMYSFDFAQMVQYPNNPDQPGAIFFKVPRKCFLFGINNEGINRQTNYVIDEAVDCGKGANVVASYLHHFFEFHGFGERFVHLQADNCAGQNKNNIVLQYLCWRTIKSLHSKISYNFMKAGHTKFSPDRSFGLLKKSYRSRFVSSLFDVAEAINLSSNTSTNCSQLTGLPDGTSLVPVYDWHEFLRHAFHKLPNISKCHHFRLDSQEPGIVYSRNFAQSDEEKHVLLKPNINLDGMPKIIQPKGLSKERIQYLYKEVRKFCRPGTEDLVAPKP